MKTPASTHPPAESRCDVLVVGGAPAGANLSAWLDRLLVNIRDVEVSAP
ncbi:MAG TPA: hypothetical protein VE029_01695 [Rhizobacter sp.]|nr:hypothetical protein [Rhizobacter sp.]